MRQMSIKWLYRGQIGCLVVPLHAGMLLIDVGESLTVNW